MKIYAFLRSLFLLFGGLSLVLAGLMASPATAGDDRGLGTPPPKGDTSTSMAAAGDAYVFREHYTANHERVDLFDFRIDQVRTNHRVNFTVLVRAVEYARSPRMATSSDGVDRGIYRYRIYEYVDGRRTGKWCIIQTVIEWGDGYADRGNLVTAYPVQTQSGNPPTVNGKSVVPSWLVDAIALGPVNDDILY